MSTTIKSTPNGSEATLHIRTSGTDSPAEHVHIDVDVPGRRAACFSVDRTELAVALATEARFTVIDNDDLPEVDEGGYVTTPFYGRMGWKVGGGLPREVLIERLQQQLIPAYAAVLRFHEQKLAEETGKEEAKKAELDAIERFISENGHTPTNTLVHALHEKGFRP